MFFFEKKNQKTFATWDRDRGYGPAQTPKSFLLLFFKKEDLPCSSRRRNSMPTRQPPNPVQFFSPGKPVSNQNDGPSPCLAKQGPQEKPALCQHQARHTVHPE